MSGKTVFISYSHKDKKWKDLLDSHLRVLEEQNLIRIWSDDKLRPGDLWLESIQNEIDGAQVAVILVSSDLLTSKFIMGKEIPLFIEQWNQKRMTIFPVIVRSCHWRAVPWLAKLQVYPKNSIPVAENESRADDEFAKIAEAIQKIVEDGSSRAQVIPKPEPEQRVLLSLHQIPSPPLDFTGRQEDISTLKTALADSRVGAIFGMGGVGKSALAFKLAEELGSVYPDAQLHLDLQGLAPRPLTPTQVMERVIRSFHPNARLPEGDDEMAGQYRSVLYGKRVLLLMDSARNRDQVEPLIPPPGSLLLMTSRLQFKLPGLVARHLDELLPKDACDLLLRIEPRIGSSVEVISNLCGRLPLALCLAGSALAERPELSPADFARRLREGKELDPVAANLKLSYELLTEPHRRFWRLLAIFPGTFDALAARAIWGLGADPAVDALGTLLRSSLVERDDKDGRFRLHDLARSLADSLLDSDERRAAQRIHSEHYLKVLRDANDLAENGESALRGLHDFDLEWRNIQAGQAWAAEHFSEDDGIARICSDYPNAGTYILQLRLHPLERIRWRRPALSAAQKLKDGKMEGTHLGNLGLAYQDLGQAGEAVKLYQQRVDIARAANDRQHEGEALGFLGNAYLELGEPRRAVDFHQQRLTLAKKIRDERGKAAALGGLGAAYRNLGDLHNAVKYHEQDLKIVRKLGDRKGEGEALNNLGLAFEELGAPQRAVAHFKNALGIAKEIRHRSGEGIALGNLGLAYEKLAEPHRAIELYEQQLAIAREIGDRRAEGSALGKLGFAYEVQNPQNAIQAFEQQLTIAQAIGDRRGEGVALGYLGAVYRRLGDLERAIEYYRQRLAIASEIGDRSSEATASWNLGLAYRGLAGSVSENLRRAADLMQTRVDYEREIGHSVDELVADVADIRALLAEESP